MDSKLETMAELQSVYKHLINEKLPAIYTQPVRFNHCFARIVLDWLFQGCWYDHLSRKQTAISQLSEQQLRRAIERMESWLQNHQLLVADNEVSLRYRGKKK